MNRGSSVRNLAANYSAGSAPNSVAPISIPDQAAAPQDENEGKAADASDLKRISSGGGAATLSADDSSGSISKGSATKYKKRFSGVGPLPKDKKLPTPPPNGADPPPSTPSTMPIPTMSSNPRNSGTGVSSSPAGKKPLRGQIEVNTTAPTGSGAPIAASPPSSSRGGGVPQTPREIEEDKANEEEENIHTEAQKEKLRRERASGRIDNNPSENYVSKADQVKILRKHLMERLGKEKLDRLLAVLESKDDDRTKAERIQELTEGKKDVLAMIHAYIYYSKP